MFRIGIFELALTCGLVVLILIVPAIISRYYAKMNQRLENIEKKIKKKD